MSEFERICRDISSVKIQGAQNIAEAAVKALMLKSDKMSLEKLMTLRPTEPALRNAVNFARKDPKRLGELALKHFDLAENKIAEYGAKKIENDMTVFTHCHSSYVMAILRKAGEQGKKFRVFNTETRPLFQGRKTAKELAALKIPVTHFVDSGARLALKDSDVFLFGADAVTSEGKVVNKIGTEMFAEMTDKYGTDVYCCTDSWKYDPDTMFGKKEPIERRDSKEVWKGAPKGVDVMNLAFEKVHPELITAIISELGVHPPQVFLQEVRRVYPWLV